MPTTGEDVQIAWISRLKATPQLVALLANNSQVKEDQWQGTNFVYPAVRVYTDFMPSINGCGPDTAEVCIEIFSEQKSSKEAQHIASTLTPILHRHPFTENGVNFPMVLVTKVDKPIRDVISWKSKVTLKVLAV